MGYEVQWSVLWDQPYRDWILEGLYLTIQISLIAWLEVSSGDSEITVAGRSNRSSASRSGSARSVPSPYGR